MQIPAKLPITPEQSRAARFQLGLTQAEVIKEGNIAGHKLKQFETGRFAPDLGFLERLRGFYRERGIELEPPPSVAQAPLASHVGGLPRAERVARAGEGGCSEDGSLTIVQRRIAANEARIADLTLRPVVRGILGGYSAACEGQIRELFGALAENYLLLCELQGRPLVKQAPREGPPSTLGNVMAQFFAHSPALGSGAGNRPPVIDGYISETKSASADGGLGCSGDYA